MSAKNQIFVLVETRQAMVLAMTNTDHCSTYLQVHILQLVWWSHQWADVYSDDLSRLED